MKKYLFKYYYYYYYYYYLIKMYLALGYNTHLTKLEFKVQIRLE